MSDALFTFNLLSILFCALICSNFSVSARRVLRFLIIMLSHGQKGHHGLYGSTSCCISHGPSQWEREIFDPHSSETPKPIFMKLEIYNYFQDMTPHAKFQGPTSTWVVWANSQFDAWKFLSFFVRFFATPTGCIFGHRPTLNTSLCVVSAKEVPFGG